MDEVTKKNKYDNQFGGTQVGVAPAASSQEEQPAAAIQAAASAAEPVAEPVVEPAVPAPAVAPAASGANQVREASQERVSAQGQGQEREEEEEEEYNTRPVRRFNRPRQLQNGFPANNNEPTVNDAQDENLSTLTVNDEESTFDNSSGPNSEPHHGAESTITQGDVQTVISELVRTPSMINKLIEALQKSGQGSMSLGGAPKRTRRRKAKRSKSAKKSR